MISDLRAKVLALRDALKDLSDSIDRLLDCDLNRAGTSSWALWLDYAEEVEKAVAKARVALQVSAS